jgi:uncharacterized protein (TIGR00290 family)
MTRRRVWLAWSSGKDGAWALHALRSRPELEVAGLLTTVNETLGRVAMHGVRASLLRAQASAVGLPLCEVPLPWPCPDGVYEARMAAGLERAKAAGVTDFAFGDLYLEDIRDYRIRQLRGTGIEPLFPLWTTPQATRALAEEMLECGVRAVLCCVDPKRLPARFAGRAFDAAFLDELPPDVDPCGERGEFHTFCCAGPAFRTPLEVEVAGVVERDGLCFADLALAGAARGRFAAGGLR